jgi:hypothetical protein
VHGELGDQKGGKERLPVTGGMPSSHMPTCAGGRDRIYDHSVNNINNNNDRPTYTRKANDNDRCDNNHSINTYNFHNIKHSINNYNYHDINHSVNNRKLNYNNHDRRANFIKRCDNDHNTLNGFSGNRGLTE